MKLLFATANKNKAREIQSMLPETFEISTLGDLPMEEDIPETSDTLQGNAQQKSDYIVKRFGLDCFADDTGLEIYALEMKPGVYSARFAGEDRNDDNNMQLVLEKLQEQENRSARFRTVISLYMQGKQYFFEGIVEGVIRMGKTGTHGFGYDPIFEPENCGKTFAEMTTAEKNNYSHRARAFQKMIAFLSDTSI